ncbi:hypothetical protein EXT46_03900 [Pseudoalteromonas sp. CO325X]|uniref:hypothetical protein n=1 Tax=Pseudoalteromonas sp. CO325X TaxID=1777262 RepID=UPI0010233199|nr:hypothetical protein [Pseudoalteromonas sp. CO325X]RZF84466.1 hypothetical protein EXT46_03900 [Pseudoalteromonas sp. CO325X]
MSSVIMAKRRPGGIRGLLICRLAAPTLLSPPWLLHSDTLSSVYVRGSITIANYCHPNALGDCATPAA